MYYKICYTINILSLKNGNNGTYMIMHEEIDMCTMFEVVVSKNESVSAFERPKMTVVTLLSISVLGFIRSRVR